MQSLISAFVACTMAFFAATAVAFGADADRGQQLWESRCFGCHGLDGDRVGPRHRGVVGRKAGAVPGYAYSPALKGASIVWDEASLDAWLADPQKLLPGQRMNFRVAVPADRADIIAYLKRESGKR